MAYKQYRNRLEKMLNKMSKKQIRQYFTLVVLFEIFYFSDDFLEIADEEDVRYLSPFVCSILIAVLVNLNDDNITLSRLLTRDLIFDCDKYLNLVFNRVNYFDHNRVFAIVLEIAHSLNLSLDRALSFHRTYTHDLDQAYYLNLELAKFITSGADFNQISQFETLSIEFYNLPRKLKSFLRALHKGDANPRISVWADIFEKMLKNNLKLEQNVIDALLALKEKDIDATVAESSEVLYSYIHGGFSDKHEMRLIILGEKGHGKTSFRSRFVDLNKPLPKPEETTEGVDFETYTIPNSEKNTAINFWDFAGDTVTHEAHKYFLTERAVYVIVYGTRQEEQSQISKWIEHIKDFAGINDETKPKIFIVVNLRHDTTTGKNVKVSINEEQLRQNYQDDFDLEFGYMNLESDNQSGGEIYKYRQKIIDYILKLDTKVPKDYMQIYEKVESEKENCFIDVARIKAIIQNVIGEYSDGILMQLHKFAFFFYYPGENGENDNERVLLKPEWITHAVYKIIRYAHEKNGVLTKEEVREALTQEDKISPDRDREFEYKRESMIWIEETLVYFRIAYKKDDKFIFPMCLKMFYDGGKTTLEFNEENSFKAYLSMPPKDVGTREQFPKDIVSSIIINNHKDLVEEDGITLATRTYARFKDENSVVEIKRDDDYLISILGQGKDFEDYTEIVLKYAEKLKKYLIENYSRFKREMPKIEVSYGKDIKNESISQVRQSILEKMQKRFDVKKDLIVYSNFEKTVLSDINEIKNGVKRIESTIFNADMLGKIDEINRQFKTFQEDIKEKIKDEEILDRIEYLEETFDNFLTAVKAEDTEKAKSKFGKFSKCFIEILGEYALEASFGLATGNILPLIKIIKKFLGL
jgi:GTPase SAR1 family protein